MTASATGGEATEGGRGPDPSPVRRHVRRRRSAIALVGALGLLVVAILLGGPPGTSTPLDPRSVEPSGMRGLLDLAEEMGTQVDISRDVPSDTSTTVLIVRDLLPDTTRDALRDWVEEGGRLVVADPMSPLTEHGTAPGPLSDQIGATSREPECEAAALQDVELATHSRWRGLEVPAGATACFPLGEGHAWLVAEDHGVGEVVALGSPAPLLNHSLDADDNAVLAAALLFPAPGERLQVVPPDPVPGGDEPPGPGDLVPPRVIQGLGLILLAVIVGLVAVGRRLGRPVEERLPPTVPAAELTRSVGDLLQRAGHRDAAAARLREQARGEVSRVLGGGLAPGQAAEQARRRLGVDHDVATAALVDAPLHDDEDLVAVAAAVAEVRDRLRVGS